ncbi:unnamed protein product, partial [Rotaria sp. Silwood1]
NLQSAGLTVDCIPNGIESYNGSPDATNYDMVILIRDNNYLADMTNNRQRSIVNAQQIAILV